MEKKIRINLGCMFFVHHVVILNQDSRQFCSAAKLDILYSSERAIPYNTDAYAHM